MSSDDRWLEISRLIKAGETGKAFAILRQAVSPQDRYVAQVKAARLFKSMPVDGLELRPLRIAIVSSFTVDYFVDVFSFWLATSGIRAEFHVAPFGMAVQTVMDEHSPLYAFKPDLVWLMTSFRDVRLGTVPGDSIETVREKVAQAVESTVNLWRILAQRAKCIVMQSNADIPAYDEFGNLSGAAPWGNRTALRLYNVELANRAENGAVIFDFDHVSSLYGKSGWVDSRHWFLAKTAFNLDACGLVAHGAARLIASAKGLAKKCLILDLDNTLWGGVIGDDGIDGIKLGAGADGEAFVAFQAFARALNARGIVLAVSSKNDAGNAEEAFEKHPDMQLKLSDIAVFRANWNNKADNIQDIARIVNLGLDSLVFVDDNPAEREIVRQLLPAVTVPELADDPADYVESLASQCLFETTAYSADDGERARFYRDNAQRQELSKNFGDLSDYLKSLDMRAQVGRADVFSLPRIAQLIGKSNQFHLTGTRYGEAEIAALSGDPDHAVLWFRLTDRFGDNGLISAVILRRIESELHIDTWVMSCRVLGRSMEEFIANAIFACAREFGCQTVVGLYRPSAKNGLVAGLYRRLGFDSAETSVAVSLWRRTVPTESRHLTTFVEHASGS